MKALIYLVGLMALLNAPALRAQDATSEFTAEVLRIGQEARESRRTNVLGTDPNWYFLTTELLHVGTGAFWEKDWTTTAVNGQDPVPSMLHFHNLLAEKGVQLLIVPVPAKATIYPEKLINGVSPDAALSNAPFVEQLQEAGLTVLDLEPLFRDAREGDQRVYCMQDAHYTPHACMLVANQIHTLIQSEPWYGDLERQSFVRSTPQELGIVGDQVPEELRTETAETLMVQYAGQEMDGGIVPVPPDPTSPILLLGDSHTLVFQEGPNRGMHSQAAGLLDQLQAEIGIPLDLVGVRGSGLKTARVQLYRHAATIPDYWANKKLVIWCFSVREFTQGFDKLVEIPIER